MKFPNHIILDMQTPSSNNTSEYWIFKYFLAAAKNENKNEFVAFNHVFVKKFLLQKERLGLNRLMRNQKRYTLRYNLTNKAEFMSAPVKKFYKKFYRTKTNVKLRLTNSKHFGKEVYDYEKAPTNYDNKFIQRLVLNYKFNDKRRNFKNTNLWHFFEINFIRKEKMYTKLKYSRVPQYDLVSGGSAALFAGFLGFLICEKFGFELLDSGDFYFLFMYAVFFFFFCRLFLKCASIKDSEWSVFSLKWLFLFYKTIFISFLFFIKSKFK